MESAVQEVPMPINAPILYSLFTIFGSLGGTHQSPHFNKHHEPEFFLLTYR